MTTNISEKDIDAIGDRYYEACLARVRAGLGKSINIASPVIRDGLSAVYTSLYDRKAPLGDVMVYRNPQEMLERENETYTSGLGVAQLDMVEQIAASRELLGEEMSPAESAIRELCYAVYDACLGDECIALVPYPHTYETDAEGELHCETGPAVAWEGQEEYYWHGQAVDKIAIEDPDAVTGEYLRDLHAEKRRATYEAIGHERAVAALGLTPVDSAEINGLSYNLFRGAEESWLKMQSPVLQDGTQPSYVEPVHEGCESCAEALGWRATGELGVAVEYEIEA